MADRLAPLPRRLLGLGMIALVVAILGTCVAVYNKVFTDTVAVGLQVDQVDNSFLEKAEVRLRGVAVGEVSEVSADGTSANLTLALNPDQVANVPRNVTARLVPKSLFGERFVSLDVPANPTAESIRAGDVITRDRSANTIELEQVFADTLPLLQAVAPADLAATLGALDQSLTGRGEQLGQTLVALHRYLQRFNPSLPDLTADVRALPKATDTLSEAVPDLVEAATDLTTTSNTLVEKEGELETTIDTVGEASDELYDFVRRNQDDLVDAVDVARPTLELLERYSPEIVCLFDQISAAVPRINKVFGTPERPALNITLEIAFTRGKYLPRKDEPEFTDNRGPMCYPQAMPPTNAPQYPGGKPFQDGATPVGATGLPTGAIPGLPGTIPGLPTLPALPSLPLLGGSSASGPSQDRPSLPGPLSGGR